MRRILCLGLFLIAGAAPAAVTLLPHTRHHLFQTYGLFTEDQVTFVFRNENRAWAALGDSVALAEAPDWWGRPQLIFDGSVNFSFLSKGSLVDFNVETFDARFALLVEMELGNQWRLQAGVQHNSGHAADGIKDPQLLAPNLGQNAFLARLLRDFGTHFRVGGTLTYLADVDPEVKRWQLDQFADYFPLGADTGWPGGAQPYLALGLQEYGTVSYDFTYHVQLGLLFGNHFQTEHRQSLRLVAGYYHGIDPRLKYAVFEHSHWDFFYAGLMLSL